MIAQKQKPADERTGFVLLWVGVLAAPILWLVQFQIRYLLVETLCRHGTLVPLYILSAIFFVLIVGAGVFSFRSWSREGKASPTDKEASPHERNLFLAALGILSSAMFALLLIAQTIGSIMVDPCRH